VVRQGKLNTSSAEAGFVEFFSQLSEGDLIITLEPVFNEILTVRIAGTMNDSAETVIRNAEAGVDKAGTLR